MVQEGIRNTIDKEQFALAIEEAYPKLDAEFRMDEDADPKITSSIAKLKEKFKGRPQPEILAAIGTDVRASGLFAPDPAGGRDNLYFPHKQYYEYIIGEIFFKALTETNPLAWARQISGIEMGSALRFEPVSIFFASGLLKIEYFDTPLVRPFWARLSDIIVNSRATIDALVAYIARPLQARATTDNILRRTVALKCPFTDRKFALRECLICDMMAALLTSLVLGAVTATNYSGSSPIWLVLIFFLPTTLYVITQVPGIFTLSLYIDKCIAFMELYRRGYFGRALKSHGPKANAALVLLAARDLPPGAIAIRPDIILDAIQTLNLRALVRDLDVLAFAREISGGILSAPSDNLASAKLTLGTPPGSGSATHAAAAPTQRGGGFQNEG